MLCEVTLTKPEPEVIRLSGTEVGFQLEATDSTPQTFRGGGRMVHPQEADGFRRQAGRQAG